MGRNRRNKKTHWRRDAHPSLSTFRFHKIGSSCVNVSSTQSWPRKFEQSTAEPRASLQGEIGCWPLSRVRRGLAELAQRFDVHPNQITQYKGAIAIQHKLQGVVARKCVRRTSLARREIRGGLQRRRAHPPQTASDRGAIRVGQMPLKIEEGEKQRLGSSAGTKLGDARLLGVRTSLLNERRTPPAKLGIGNNSGIFCLSGACHARPRTKK